MHENLAIYRAQGWQEYARAGRRAMTGCSCGKLPDRDGIAALIT